MGATSAWQSYVTNPWRSLFRGCTPTTLMSHLFRPDLFRIREQGHDVVLESFRAVWPLVGIKKLVDSFVGGNGQSIDGVIQLLHHGDNKVNVKLLRGRLWRAKRIQALVVWYCSTFCFTPAIQLKET